MPAEAVRTRRAYFDFRFGQLHVRTAFPATGGFDEQVTLFCLHPEQSSSRFFAKFLPEIAGVRSVYAPDLPGCGESDPATSSIADAGDAIADLANDLRLRQIDLLGMQWGARGAVQVAAGKPELVRRLVLIGLRGADLARAKAAVPHARFVDLAEYKEDVFDTAAKTLALQ